VTARQARDSIEPGSVPSGDRAGLEAGLATVLGQGGGAPGGPAAPVDPVQVGNDPLAALTSGGLTMPENGPITSGLSVGAGPGPEVEDPLNTDKARQLRLLATQARTPALRQTAIRMLKRMASGKDRV